MNQNEPIFLNLYIRDTESYRKITKIVGNKQSNYSAPPMGMSNRLTVVLQQELH